MEEVKTLDVPLPAVDAWPENVPLPDKPTAAELAKIIETCATLSKQRALGSSEFIKWAVRNDEWLRSVAGKRVHAEARMLITLNRAHARAKLTCKEVVNLIIDYNECESAPTIDPDVQWPATIHLSERAGFISEAFYKAIAENPRLIHSAEFVAWLAADHARRVQQAEAMK